MFKFKALTKILFAAANLANLEMAFGVWVRKCINTHTYDCNNTYSLCHSKLHTHNDSAIQQIFRFDLVRYTLVVFF